MSNIILIRGGGDLASGVALRLHRSGLKVLISELAEPLAVRRTVSFGEAVYEGQWAIEGITGRLVKQDQIPAVINAGEIPVLIDPEASILKNMKIPVVVDGRLTKHPPAPLPVDIPLHIGLGPGFHAGLNCHAVIETKRGHTLGRVYYDGPTQPDSRQPEGDQRRVLRAPAEGRLIASAKISDHVKVGQVIAVIDGQHQVLSPFDGVLRGLIRPGLRVSKGLKIGDVDPRNDPTMCSLVSDKALSIAGAVLEVILSGRDFWEKS